MTGNTLHIMKGTWSLLYCKFLIWCIRLNSSSNSLP